MSLLTFVEFGKPVDDKYIKYKNVWDACEAANIPIPEEVLSFFEYKAPDGLAIWTMAKEDYIDGKFKDPAVTRVTAPGSESYIIDLSKLPADTKLIKITNSF
jgi:hypothetical protein